MAISIKTDTYCPPKSKLAIVKHILFILASLFI